MQNMTFAELLANKRGEPGTIPMAHGTEIGSKMTMTNTLQLMKNSKVAPDEAGYAIARKMLTEITGLSFTDDQTHMLLELNPRVRIHLVTTKQVLEPYRSEHVKKELEFAAAHFFLMCSWPHWEPGAQLDTFKALLIKQGVALGFDKAH